MKSKFVGKFKAIPSTAHTLPIFQIFLNKQFLWKSSQPGLENLVLILQFEWDRNFGDIRANILEVWTYYGFSRSLCYDDTRHWN